ncbi:putative deoxyxylulose-5-phosphate synthase [Fibrobacter succinogenes subsp. succinogenes S85]|uniref:1-deoxy-D-xylulose-5-phosphate synthase n=1 Tax=Fibrobacter succinogenes (strain ATCC 19169 / S85) TaxID=59374 RepID=C9RN61_FIBSS|nr:1-deoxy-D-xylulose-5-phosphate synthase [Fibrobacter succinogenes]ACX76313.1 1-deoxy-D-xylulose-5-phosphate synthase [Fibrobacter succinogenes subsp. succinogenes S85]ADL27377.1 putative deoxyxylulose-5-phosphate synthase [Fibrobacter succinogenes subsp. succinogenes S85]
MLLEKIKSPADVKALDIKSLEQLAAEMRTALLKKLSKRGGHVAPNLGFVEGTIALHYVFDSPRDKIVYDVSHQSYSHKMLTGRAQAFLEESHYGDVTGYSEPTESEHDFFMVGHTSTSVSLALGLATARDVLRESGNVIAVIGDGSLSGGEAFEGLDNAGEYATNFIVVVNDNEMSIAENHGGLYKSLAELRTTAGKSENNYFKSLGFDYKYLEQGNDIASLIEIFKSVKNSTRPVVVHLHTQKGRGYSYAEQNREGWHWAAPFNIETSEINWGSGENYGEILGLYLMAKIKSDPKVVVIHSAVPAGIGFYEARRKEAGKQYIDVGIAEEHAVALASGLAKGGAKPIYSTHGTFIQRTYDQLSQDLCANNNPATILVTMSGADGMNDTTHLCIFDIPMLSNIPNLVYLCPTCVEEFKTMADWAIDQTEHPVAIRVPNAVHHRSDIFEKDYSRLNKFKVVHRGERVALIGLGDFYQRAAAVALELRREGIDATLVNPRYASGVDKDLLLELAKTHDVFVTLENGVIEGGFGQKVATALGDTCAKVLVRGLSKEFYDKVSFADLCEKNHLNPSQVAKDVMQLLS